MIWAGSSSRATTGSPRYLTRRSPPRGGGGTSATRPESSPTSRPRTTSSSRSSRAWPNWRPRPAAVCPPLDPDERRRRALGAGAGGAFGRFFDGTAADADRTAWQTNGGLALEIAAAALIPTGAATGDPGRPPAVSVGHLGTAWVGDCSRLGHRPARHTRRAVLRVGSRTGPDRWPRDVQPHRHLARQIELGPKHPEPCSSPGAGRRRHPHARSSPEPKTARKATRSSTSPATVAHLDAVDPMGLVGRARRPPIEWRRRRRHGHPHEPVTTTIPRRRRRRGRFSLIA